jgi:hypothetical protein
MAGTADVPGATPRTAARRHVAYAIVVIALLAQMAGAMITTAVQQTPTIDEPVYVGAAAVYLQRHDLRDNPEHPPLGKLLIGAGSAFTHPRLDPGFTGSQEQIGRHLLYESGNDPGRLLVAARLPVIVLTLLFGLVVLAFARDLTGPAGGLVALTLYAFAPNLIAHGSLATLDVAVSGFVLTTAWCLWRARHRPLPYLPLSGLALGAALATKMNALAAAPILLALAFTAPWPAHRHEPPGTGRRVGQGIGRRNRPRAGQGIGRGIVAVLGVSLIAVAVVWASYLAVDPRLRWTPPANVPDVHGLRGLLAGLLPFPAPYRDGLRIQFAFDDAAWAGFLFGRQYVGHLWYYLPAALLVKTPIGSLALWATGTATMLGRRRLRPAAPYVLLPAAALLTVAMTGSRDLGIRYALILPMALAVASACVTALWTAAPALPRTSTRRRWTMAATAALLAFVAVSSLRTYPYYLPYSNEAFGGPADTHLHLHDSNVDWGQDLGRLATHLREHYPHERIWLVYKGRGVPSAYGLTAPDPRTAPLDQVHGILAISDSQIAKSGPRLQALIATSRPIDDVGHSITIYRR